MGKPQSKKGQQGGLKHISKKYRTKRKTKDLDEIHEDLKPAKAAKLLDQEVDLDLPGAGQHYCLSCARHFTDDHSYNEHLRTKPHKRRLKALETEPYTQAEADKAAGMGCYLPSKRQKIVVPTKESLLGSAIQTD